MSEKFLQWCSKNDIQQTQIQIQQIDQYDRGIYSTEILQKEQLILQVPNKLLLHAGKAEEILQEILSQQLEEIQIFGLCILKQISKAENSIWFEYFKTLPREFFTFHCFNSDEINLLQIDYAKNRALQIQRQVEKNWSTVKPLMKKFKISKKLQSLKIWQWIEACISSRTMYMPGYALGTLTPFGDMFNHVQPPIEFTPQIGKNQLLYYNFYQNKLGGTGLWNEKTENYEILTGDKYLSGEEIFLTYGVYTNLELLELYGFQIFQNSQDIALLPIQMFKNVNCNNNNINNNINNDMNESECGLHFNGQPTWSLLTNLRLKFCEKNSQERINVLEGNMLTEKKFENLVVQQIKNVILQILKQLPSTVVQDGILLDGWDGSVKGKFAMQWENELQVDIVDRVQNMLEFYRE